MSTQILEGQRFVILSTDIPWPANRGGRADIWRRLLALREHGAKVFLIHLYEDAGPQAPRPQDWAALKAHLDGHFALPMQRSLPLTLRRLATLPWLPWHAATRVPPAAVKAGVVQTARHFAPTAVWLEGPWFAELARAIQQACGVPLLYRSHNIEHRYLRGQAAAAASLRNRIAWRLACVGVQRFEWRLLREAQAVFDISMDDLEFWRRRGVPGGYWLPPLPESAVLPNVADAVPGDLVFSGNLRTPNNLLGLQWLIEEVMPRVAQADPDARLSVIGSMPDADWRERLAALPFVQAHFNVDSVQPYLSGARVLLNPVFIGSGVQLKTLDMLSTDTPIVSRSQGLRGLPSEVGNLLHVADRAEEFAAAILRARTSSEPSLSARREFRQQFSPEGVASCIANALRDVQGKRSERVA